MTRKRKLRKPKCLFLEGRSSASSGLWLCLLLPAVCSTAFYSVYSQCNPPSYVIAILAIQTGISAVYILLNTFCKQETQNGIGSYPPLPKSWMIFLVTQPFVPIIVSCIAFSVYENSDAVTYVSSILCCLIQHCLTGWIFQHFFDSFSIGEGLLVGQAGSLTLTLCLKGLFTVSSASLEEQEMSLFLQTAIIVSSLLAYLIWSFRSRLSIWSFLLLLSLFGVGGVVLSSLMFDEFVLTWLWRAMFLSPSRISLLGWWTNVAVLIFITAAVSQRYTHIPQTVLRKSFHVLMILIIMPGIILDPFLTHFATAAAMIMFILLELLRAIRLQPISSALDALFDIFLDSKDTGALVLSHIYLLAGVCLPLWLFPCHFAVTNPSQETRLFSRPVMATPYVLPLLSGVIAVGIGDTMASIGGTYFGWHRLPGTVKTFEGSGLSALSQILSVSLLIKAGVVPVVTETWLRVVVAVGITTLVEAFTDQVDNLVLPLLMYIPLVQY